MMYSRGSRSKVINSYWESTVLPVVLKNPLANLTANGLLKVSQEAKVHIGFGMSICVMHHRDCGWHLVAWKSKVPKALASVAILPHPWVEALKPCIRSKTIQEAITPVISLEVLEGLIYYLQGEGLLTINSTRSFK